MNRQRTMRHQNDESADEALSPFIDMVFLLVVSLALCARADEADRHAVTRSPFGADQAYVEAHPETGISVELTQAERLLVDGEPVVEANLIHAVLQRIDGTRRHVNWHVHPDARSAAATRAYLLLSEEFVVNFVLETSTPGASP